jgi:ribose 5-phosphate isomerase A
MRLQALNTPPNSLVKKAFLSLKSTPSLDLTVDGADEIDAEKQMIKGGGGALLREKIVARMSREMVVIIDETKLVSKLGQHPLPVEIIPFGYLSTLHQLERLGYVGHLRCRPDQTPYLTDNGHYIFDIQLDPKKTHPRADHERLIQVPGVVETGFFFDLAKRVIIGFLDGQIVIQ